MMNTTATQKQMMREAVRTAGVSLQGKPGDFDALMGVIGDANFVLLGEASHGTHEFYQARAEITKRLLKEKQFTAIAVEADWPDAYRVNRYVRGRDDDHNGREALAGFQRFPLWMWRNVDVLAFIDWLRTYNSTLPEGQPKIGFYGLDLYSLYRSIQAVITYLERVDPEAAKRARERYACFEQFGEDTEAYGYAAGLRLSSSCEDEVVRQLIELQQHPPIMTTHTEPIAEDEFFSASQNARLVKNAEKYYRTLFQGRVSSWNLRDRHMAETLAALVEHFEQQGVRPKIVVRAHNSHLGDARATSQSQQKELNVGQLVRERYGNTARLIGFTTYTGTVTAASDWDGPHERKRVRPALPESYETLFHQAKGEPFFLSLQDEHIAHALATPQLERAIGVIYRPQTERLSHYFSAHLPEQFDAIFHFDDTQAVEPLDPGEKWKANEEAPETYPFTI